MASAYRTPRTPGRSSGSVSAARSGSATPPAQRATRTRSFSPCVGSYPVGAGTIVNPNEPNAPTVTTTVIGTAPPVVHEREYYVYNDDHIASVEGMSRRIAEQQQEMINYRNRIYELTSVAERLTVENRELYRLLDIARNEEVRTARLRDENGVLMEERHVLFSEVSKLEDEWNQEVKRLKEDNRSLTAQLDALEAKLNRFVTNEDEARTLEQKIEKMNATIESQARDLTRMTQMEQEIARLEAALKQEMTNRVNAEELAAKQTTELANLRAAKEQLEKQLIDSRSQVYPSNRHLLPKLRPMLGIEIKMLDDGLGGRDNVVCVHSVISGGPADVAGIKPEDVIQAWNGRLLDSKAKFQKLLEDSAIGTQVTLDIWRTGRTLRIPVTVGGTSLAFGLRRRNVVNK